jgi:hypothetical protein
MTLEHCDREQEVVDALRSGRWLSEWGLAVRQHAQTCPVCAEVALAAQAFQREAALAQAELEQPGAHLPSAGLVWWKAQLAARRAAEKRAAEPIVWVERAAYAVGVIATLALGIWQRRRVAGWFHPAQFAPQWPRAAFVDLSPTTDRVHRLAQVWTSPSPWFLLAATAAFLTFAAFTAYLAYREE